MYPYNFWEYTMLMSGGIWIFNFYDKYGVGEGMSILIETHTYYISWQNYK